MGRCLMSGGPVLCGSTLKEEEQDPRVPSFKMIMQVPLLCPHR